MRWHKNFRGVINEPHVLMSVEPEGGQQGGGGGGAAGGGAGQGAGASGAGGSTPPDMGQYLTKEEFGKSAAIISRLNKTIESMAQNSLTLDKLAEIGMVEKMEDGTYKPKAPAPAAGRGAAPPPTDPEPWKREIDKLKGDLKKKDELLEAEQRRAAERERDNVLKAALAKGGAVNPDRDYVHLSTAVQKDADGNYFFPGKDKYGVDKQFSVDEYVEIFLTQNLELKRAANNGGSGTPPGGGGSGSKDGKPVIPKSVWSANYAAYRDKAMKNEVVLSDQG